jgi:GTPase
LIDGIYSVVDHPTIVCGLLKSGFVKSNDNLLIGPLYDGSYKQVNVRSIHCKRKDVKEAFAGEYICMSLNNITRKEVIKGMVIVKDDYKSKIAIKEFWAIINILHSPTTIKVGYAPHAHIDQINQTVRISEIIKIESKPQTDSVAKDTKEELNVLRTGDIAKIKLSFVRKPEYIKPDMKLIFRERKVIAVGKIISVGKVI